MIIFKWEEYYSEKLKNDFIKWECSFDGKLDDMECFKDVNRNLFSSRCALAHGHPFERTFIYQDDLKKAPEWREIQAEFGWERIGDIVAHNYATQGLCVAIDDILENRNLNTGIISNYDYFQRLLAALCTLWD